MAETICLALKNLVLASPRPPATFSYSGTSLLDEGQGESGLDVVLQANLGGSAAFGPLFASIVHSDQHIHIVNLHQPQLRTVLAREPQGHKPGHELHILVLEPQTFGKYTVSLWMVGSYKTTARNCEWFFHSIAVGSLLSTFNEIGSMMRGMLLFGRMCQSPSTTRGPKT